MLVRKDKDKGIGSSGNKKEEKSNVNAKHSYFTPIPSDSSSNTTYSL